LSGAGDAAPRRDDTETALGEGTRASGSAGGARLASVRGLGGVSRTFEDWLDEPLVPFNPGRPEADPPPLRDASDGRGRPACGPILISSKRIGISYAPSGSLSGTFMSCNGAELPSIVRKSFTRATRKLAWSSALSVCHLYVRASVILNPWGCSHV
jgi:hypothetical protein